MGRLRPAFKPREVRALKALAKAHRQTFDALHALEAGVMTVDEVRERLLFGHPVSEPVVVGSMSEAEFEAMCREMNAAHGAGLMIVPR